MKITRLRLAGFGPYKGEQSVDFESFDDDGIFLITGKTGAGKSSILDAICFALYDTVPRYEQRASPLRSDHCDPADPTFVELEFSLGDATYRVHRTPRFERPKQRGEGMATAQPTAELSIKDGDGWRTIAVGPRDVGNEVSRILPIRADQFLQVILLAQNRFQQFLLAKTDERRAVLRTLFGTSRFEQLEKLLAERNKALTLEVAGVRQHIDLLATSASKLVGLHSTDEGEATEKDERVEAQDTGSAAWFTAVLSAVADIRDSAVKAAEQSLELVTSAASAAQSAETIRDRQDRRNAASGRLAALEALADVVEASRVELDAARRALRVWPFVEAMDAAERALTIAQKSATDAIGSWRVVDESHTDAGAEPTLEQLGDAIETRLTERGSLTELADDERRLPALERERSTLDAAVDVAASRVETGRARVAAIPVELDAAGARVTQATAVAALMDGARASESRIVGAVEAAKSALRLEGLREAALQSRKQASSANAIAAAEYDELLDRRLSGHAAELAGALVPGEPCAVCGSTSHPQPASSDSTPVTEADIDDAGASRLEKQSALSAADAEVHRHSSELERARGAAGEATLDELLLELESARAQIAAATTASRQLIDSEKLTARLVAERDTAAAHSSVADLKLEQARAAVTAHRTTVAVIVGRITANLTGHASIRDRISALDAFLTAARVLAAALERVADARTAVGTTTTMLMAQLDETDFGDRTAADVARRTKSEVTDLERRLRDHDGGLAAARSTLAEAELHDLPVDLVDLAPTRRLLAQATTARESTSAVAHAAEARHAQLIALATEATGLLTTSVDLISEQKHVRELAELVVGRGSNTRRIRLETYVLAARLEQIILAANLRLKTMSGGRYALELDDQRQHFDAETGLGLSIRDSHTGRARATHSLSGGETFLASLALALGLAEVVSSQAGGIALDTLFVDEGFGSLDSETLDIAMSTLDGLRAGGRTVGLISHVDSMKEQIPAKLHIVVEATGASRIETPADGGAA